MTRSLREGAWSDLDFIHRTDNGLERERNQRQTNKLRSSSALDDNLTTNVRELEGMGSRNILDEAEFEDKWLLGHDDSVGGVKDDSQVSNNKSPSLQRRRLGSQI